MTHSEAAKAAYPDPNPESRGDVLTEGKSTDRERTAFDRGRAEALAGDSWRATAEVILERINVQDQPALDFIAKVVALAPLPVVVSDSTNPSDEARKNLIAKITALVGDAARGYDLSNYKESTFLRDVLDALDAYDSHRPLSDSTALIEAARIVRDIRSGEDTRSVAAIARDLLAALRPLGVAETTSEGEGR